HRGRILCKLAEKIRRNAAQLAELECRNSGKPIVEAEYDIADAATCFEYYAGLANKVLEAGVVFKTGCGVGDVVFGFDDGLAGIAAFQFGKLRGVPANLLRQLAKNAAAMGGSGLAPGTGIKRGARGLDSTIDIGGCAR